MTPIAPKRQHGMAYLAAMFAVFLIVLAVSAAGIVWKIEAQRQAEAELIFDGQQIAHALGSYSDRHGSKFPNRMDQLLGDEQSLQVHRDLRRLFIDPMTGTSDWGTVRSPTGTIVAVYSRSLGKPVQTAHFPAGLEAFASAKTYQDWIFLPPKNEPPKVGTGLAGSANGTSATQPLTGRARFGF